MAFSSTAKPYTDNFCRQIRTNTSEQRPKLDIGDLYQNASRLCRLLMRKIGAYSMGEVKGAGFQYNDHLDIAFCPKCKLQVPSSAFDMKPFAIHSQRSPTCPFVLSMLPPNIITKDAINHLLPTISPSLQSVFTDTTSLNMSIDSFMEVDIVKQVRKRTFSHWPHTSSSSQMIEAGFFSCNVGDRVMCIYCNLICQQWNSFTDDPCDVHKTLSPNCVYVCSVLTNSTTSSLHNSNNTYRCDAIVPTMSFLEWSDESALARLVTARSDRSTPMSLFQSDFKSSIIKRCWEDQLRLKHEDFVSECDLLVACTILQKQIECIAGKKENILTPEKAMKKIQEEQRDIRIRRQFIVGSSPVDVSNNHNYDEMDMAISSSSSSRTRIFHTVSMHSNNLRTSIFEGVGQNQTNHTLLSDCCMISHAALKQDHHLHH